jgi:hypothetical protein
MATLFAFYLMIGLPAHGALGAADIRLAALLEADSPTSIQPPGSSQDPSSARRTNSTRPVSSRTTAKAAGR